MYRRSRYKKNDSSSKNNLSTKELLFWFFILCVVIGTAWYIIFNSVKKEGDTFYDFVKFNLKLEIAFRAIGGIFSSIFG